MREEKKFYALNSPSAGASAVIKMSPSLIEVLLLPSLVERSEPERSVPERVASNSLKNERSPASVSVTLSGISRGMLGMVEVEADGNVGIWGSVTL